MAAGWAVACVLAGCALRSADVTPLPASAEQFASLDCARLDDEAQLAQRRAVELAWAVDERAGTNIVALGVGITVFWPALLALRPQGPEAEELARLKGRFEALREAAMRKACAPWSAELSRERAAALPVAAGDRLVYELRPNAKRPGQEEVWALQALRRDELEYTVATPNGGVAVLQDRLGNVLAAPPGMLIWPYMLRGDLALGQVMAGEMQVAGDPQSRARVRAQVVAVGPQSIGERRFDVAVLELFGDVLQGAGSTRLDGALVVDRSSGVLLRLDLRSAEPPFRGTRRLARVEGPAR